MKYFLKMTAASCLSMIIGVCLFLGLIMFMLFSFIMSAHQMANVSRVIPQSAGGVMVIDLSQLVSKKPVSSESVEFVFGEGLGLNDSQISASIFVASQDANITEILLVGNANEGNYSFAQLASVRYALQAFKLQGKSVYAYIDNVDFRTYWLYSVADRIFMNPIGDIDMSGIGINSPFFGNALKKYGVGVQVVKCGKYKSFGDMFTQDKYSDGTRENIKQLASDLWNLIYAQVSESRKIDIKYVSETNPFMPAETAKERGFVDEIIYRDELNNILSLEKQCTILSYASLNTNLFQKNAGIAIVYMDGDIVSYGDSQQCISSTEYRRIFREISNDNYIKAVILRINSGGGSAYASEEIRREVALLAEKKFVVTSVSSMAASGAYWIATASNKIFAQQESVIGSIGVFGIFFDIQKLSNDFGVTYDGVDISPYANAFTITRPKTQAELDKVQILVDGIYEKFCNLVIKSRGIDSGKIADIATGEVWLSERAYAMKLIDGTASLDEVISYVVHEKNLAGVGIISYPRPKTFKDKLKAFFGQRDELLIKQFGKNSFSSKFLDVKNVMKYFDDKNSVYARIPYALEL